MKEAKVTLLNVFEGRNCLTQTYGSYTRHLARSIRGSSNVSSFRRYPFIPSDISFVVDMEDCA